MMCINGNLYTFYTQAIFREMLKQEGITNIITMKYNLYVFKETYFRKLK